MWIAHISDLHISGSYYVPEWGKKLKKNLKELNPELIIITGDLTDWGYLHEYEIANEYIEQIECECKRLIVPGNHDARNKGYEIFEEIFKTRYPVFERNNSIRIVYNQCLHVI